MGLKDFNRKQIILLVSLLLIVIAIPITLYLSQKTQIFKPRAEEVVTPSPPVIEISKDHPSLFQIYLEYNPDTNTITEISSGRTNGDIPFVNSSPIPASPDQFVYKIEVISEKNQPLQTGWKSISKEIATTPNGNLRFRVYTLYKPRSIIQISIPDGRVIWTGNIP